VRRGPNVGKVVCCICKKYLPANEAVGLNGRPCHVEVCFGEALKRIGKALEVVDINGFTAEMAYKIGRQTGDHLKALEK
jgi:hypothetical protein